MPTPKKVEFIARGVAVADGRVLVCRDVSGGYCYLPGGHVEPGEPAAAGLEREFLEETGLRVRTGSFLLASENIFEQGGKARHEINLLFHVERASGAWPDPVASLEDDIAFEWIEPAALPESGLLPPSILAWLLAGGRSDSVHDAWISHAAPPH